jgi:NAD(P)-dependent dehydrogenase (short-subunit alcohol dehydrogenase family)
LSEREESDVSSWVVITGAGRGIGATIAEHVARAGYRVALWDVDRRAAEAVAGRIGEGAVACEVDVTDEAAVSRGLERLPDIPGAVVNNAGIVRFGPLLDLSLRDWEQALRVNLTGSFIVARAAARMMATVGAGSIVNIASINGLSAAPFSGSYSASKAAVVMLSQQMALEWAGAGIRVNCVAPGLIDAGMSEPIYDDPQVRELRQARVPLEKLGSADDVAVAVLYFISDRAAYVTGQTLAVDGGISISALRALARPASVDSVGA